MRVLQDLIEDCEWILGSSTDPAVIAKRLGYTSPQALVRKLDRAGRRDLARQLDRKAVAA